MGVRKNVKLTEIHSYLSLEMKTNKKLENMLLSLGIYNVYAETFMAEFGKMSPKEMAEFIDEHTYEIGMWRTRQGYVNVGTGRYLDCNGRKYNNPISTDRGIS